MAEAARNERVIFREERNRALDCVFLQGEYIREEKRVDPFQTLATPEGEEENLFLDLSEGAGVPFFPPSVSIFRCVIFIYFFSPSVF